MTRFATAEIVSQPDCWERAADAAGAYRAVLPAAGERVAVVGCGSSWFIGQSYAALRERAGLGETDAFACSEFPPGRSYDRLVAISRSGTTTEVLDLLDKVRGRVRTVVLTAVPTAPVVNLADATVDLSFADEESVVQTRSATSALVLLRSSLDEDLTSVINDGRAALRTPLEPLVSARQFSFLGTGWTIGLALEAALKMRESAQLWTEAYPALEYRHGPISIAELGRVTWQFGPPPAGLADEVAATGATFVDSGDLDPLAHLVVAQRLAIEIADRLGLDPDRPRHLSRSVILSPAS